MMNDVQAQKSEKVEVRKESRKRTHFDNGMSQTTEHRQVEEVEDGSGSVRQERVVRDSGAERAGIAHKAGQVVWLLAGLLEMALGLRFLLKLIAANPNTPFVQLLYRVTGYFLAPFHAITGTPAVNGSVLEIPTVIAMLVYAGIAWAIVKLIYVAIMPATSEQVTVYRREER